MFERLAPLFKLACLGLAVLFLWQCARLLAGRDPVGDLNLPAALLSPPASPTPVEPQKTNARPAEATAQKTPLPPLEPRLERVVQSEILGPVVRPLPMALLGIAGREAFLRAPNGQTGLLKEGEELGGVKLLRLGTNRALIELEGQQQELTLFAGFGGETLLPKEKVSSP